MSEACCLPAAEILPSSCVHTVQVSVFKSANIAPKPCTL